MSSSQTLSSSSNETPADAPVAALDAPLPCAHLLDVVCPIQVLLGTGLITVRQVLSLERHSILTLLQSAGEDLRLAANGIVLAKGEVVIVDDSTALRITEIAPAPGVEAHS
jgi:flagellar motor switch/type III secretory pathway protein FliN